MTATKTGEIPGGRQLAGKPTKSQPVSAPPAVTQEDWQAFCTLDTLAREAGVPAANLTKLVVKELADNALDASEDCELGTLRDDRGMLIGAWVQNFGAIPGTPADIAHLFSVRRPMNSTKYYRRPSRGAMGNGLRVVAGAVLASGGTLTVCTGGRQLTLVPQTDGFTSVVTVTDSSPSLSPAEMTRVEVTFGSRLPVYGDVLDWGEIAKEIARNTAEQPTARPCIHWHDIDSFTRLVRGVGPDVAIRQIVEQFARLSGPATSRVLAGLSGPAAELTPTDVQGLLTRMKQAAPALSVKALGRVGDLSDWGRPKREEQSVLTGAGHRVPALIEVWAKPSGRAGATHSAALCLNRTPCGANVSLYTGKHGGKKALIISGAGLNRYIDGVKYEPGVDLLINIQCPAYPTVDRSKTPDLSQLAGLLCGDIVPKCVKSAQRVGAADKPRGDRQADIVRANLDAAVADISRNGSLRYSLRQLFYALRPKLIEALNREPLYGTFTDIIDKIEDERGTDLLNIYRDNRGTLYHPHDGFTMPLGTRTVEGYKRPSWLFNKVLYCEKEGFFPLLQDARFPERHDCALLTSKGYAAKAVGDVLSMMGDSAEPVAVFCVHDADGPGTRIYQSLQEMADSRNARRGGGRPIRVIDLGLNPEEALELALPVEPVVRDGDRTVTTGDYLDDEWRDWLQTHRVELNAMPPAAFLEWLEGKMADYVGKVEPPRDAVEQYLRAELERVVRDRHMRTILDDNGFEEGVRATLTELEPWVTVNADRMADEMPQVLEELPDEHWRGVVAERADIYDRSDETG